MTAAHPFRTIHVLQGEHQVSDCLDTVMTTVLGSCVSACLHDPVRRIGGMNHFLLPGEPGSSDQRHAFAAMERLVNGLVKEGALRGRLEARIFGGGRMMAGLPDIGRRNGEAALSFLRGEGIPLVAQSLGGTSARRLRFWPATGQAQQVLVEAEVDTARMARPATGYGSIELF